MSALSTIQANARAISQMPRPPASADETVAYDKLLDAIDEMIVEGDPSTIALSKLADRSGTPLATADRFFPNPEAAAAGLALRYVELAAKEIMSDQTASGAENWQDVVSEILNRGRVFYKKYPAAAKLRLGTGQSASVRHIMLQSTWGLAGAIGGELERIFIIPSNLDLVTELCYAIVISDALWSLSYTLHEDITDDLAEEAERAVSSLLIPILGSRLTQRAA